MWNLHGLSNLDFDDFWDKTSVRCTSDHRGFLSTFIFDHMLASHTFLRQHHQFNRVEPSPLCSLYLIYSLNSQLKFFSLSQKVASYEAHPDYIRAIAVHPTLPYFLTASDDMTIKLWDMDQNFKCLRVFEGHAHYVRVMVIYSSDSANLLPGYVYRFQP
jgi:WD40 repeat protein